MTDEPYGGVYRAKAVSVTDAGAVCLVPQVFRDTTVLVDRWSAPLPPSGTLGYVVFLSGDPAWPVWVGTAEVPPGPSAASRLAAAVVDAEDFAALKAAVQSLLPTL